MANRRPPYQIVPPEGARWADTDEPAAAPERKEPGPSWDELQAQPPSSLGAAAASEDERGSDS